MKRSGTVYEYTRLVESYRENGKPTHRVTMSPKDWTPAAIDGLRLLASRKEHRRLVFEVSSAGQAKCHAVHGDLEYLSIAVLDDRWTSCDPTGLLDTATWSGRSRSTAALGALADADAAVSKAAACRWQLAPDHCPP